VERRARKRAYFGAQVGNLLNGSIEAGIRSDLAKLGIGEPGTALERLAVRLAQMLDAPIDERHAAGLARELRLTMAAVEAQPKPTADAVGELAARVGSS
jgi:hypothetical protein